MKNYLLTLMVITITGCYSFGQSSVTPQVINSTGGTYTLNHYILDWSVGELALINQMNPYGYNYIVSNGFLQPFTQDPNLVNNDRLFEDGEILILPNPTQNILEIDFRTKQIGAMTFRLYDIQGRKLFANSFKYFGTGRIEKIDMTGASTGTYFLHIELNPDQGFIHKVGSFKILKL